MQATFPRSKVPVIYTKRDYLAFQSAKLRKIVLKRKLFSNYFCLSPIFFVFLCS